MTKHGSIIERFRQKYIVCQDSGCWLWTAYCDECGYGRFKENGRSGKWRGAHRIAYELHVGPIPEGMEIDHLCRNRNCVNPDHLEAVTHQENCRRAADSGSYGKRNRQKTHCPQGHPYDEENTYYYPNGNRRCMICNREAQRRIYERRNRRKNAYAESR